MVSAGGGSRLPDDVEMVIERRHLVDLGLQPHLLGKRAKVGGRQMAVSVWIG